LFCTNQATVFPSIQVLQIAWNGKLSILNNFVKGAFGQVYKVKDKKDGRFYALKIIQINETKPKSEMRAKSEVRALYNLKNEFIIQLHGAYSESIAKWLFRIKKFKLNFTVKLRPLAFKRKTTAKNQIIDEFKNKENSKVSNEFERMKKELLVGHSSSDECNPKYKKKVKIKSNVVRIVLLKLELCERKSLQCYLLMNVERDKVLMLNWYSQYTDTKRSHVYSQSKLPP